MLRAAVTELKEGFGATCGGVTQGIARRPAESGRTRPPRIREAKTGSLEGAERAATTGALSPPEPDDGGQ
jgi:hypothetical protein